MQAILDSHPGLRAVVAEAPRYRLQAVIGRIEPGPDGRPVLVQQGFRLGAEYFYPASSVKLFAAVAAFERLAELRREAGLAIGPDTALVYHPQFDGEELADNWILSPLFISPFITRNITSIPRYELYSESKIKA
jgi:hypothetical protein